MFRSVHVHAVQHHLHNQISAMRTKTAVVGHVRTPHHTSIGGPRAGTLPAQYLTPGGLQHNLNHSPGAACTVHLPVQATPARLHVCSQLSDQTVIKLTGSRNPVLPQSHSKHIMGSYRASAAPGTTWCVPQPCFTMQSSQCSAPLIGNHIDTSKHLPGITTLGMGRTGRHFYDTIFIQ